jgi:hypothetical protein
MEKMRTSETSIYFHQAARRCIPEICYLPSTVSFQALHNAHNSCPYSTVAMQRPLVIFLLQYRKPCLCICRSQRLGLYPVSSFLSGEELKKKSNMLSIKMYRLTYITHACIHTSIRSSIHTYTHTYTHTHTHTHTMNKIQVVFHMHRYSLSSLSYLHLVAVAANNIFYEENACNLKC